MPRTTVQAESRTRQAARSERHAARRVLWSETTLDRVRSCGRHGVLPDGAVMLRATGLGAARRAGLSGVATCASTWACPVCSYSIAARRAVEVAESIEAWRSTGGRIVVMALTMRHHEGQRLANLWDNLSYAWGCVTSGRAWKGEQQSYGVAGWVRVVESTHGPSGWHVHVHALLFIEGTADLGGLALWTGDDEGLVRGLSVAMFGRWSAALVRKGMRAPLRDSGGLDARWYVGAAKAAGDYLTKSTFTPAESVGWEIAGGSGKIAAAGHRTPFAILADVVARGDCDDLDLWHEWERASHGRRQFGWSRGVRDRLALADESTDDQIIEEDALAGDDLVLIDGPSFRAYALAGIIPRLLDTAESDDTGDAVRKLVRWFTLNGPLTLVAPT